MDDTLRTTPFHTWHQEAGAKMMVFAGWKMPLQYPDGAIAEHRLVRESVGLFDVSHMGRVRVTGAGATAFLERLLTNSIAALDVGGSSYSVMCREDGTAIDDVFVYRQADGFLVVLNAANHDRDMAWIRDHTPAGVSVTDITEQTAMVAVQGPNALQVIDRLTDSPASEIPRFSFQQRQLADAKVTVARTGYTGEDGVELYIPVAHAQPVWNAVLAEAQAAGIAAGPCGLAARDSLRFEPGFALYGHELDDQTTPIEARLAWACDFDTPFIGREALLRQKADGVAKKLATVRLTEPGVPRQGFNVMAAEDEPAGVVASGMYAPTVDAYCANVFVRPDLARTGTIVHIEIRDRLRTAEVVKRPLYKPAYRA